jgi:hypothetical protein
MGEYDEYTLVRTSERLQVQLYHPLDRLFPCERPKGVRSVWGVLVARGDSFDSPVIIGRPVHAHWLNGELRVWEPLHGFNDSNNIVRKLKEDGRAKKQRFNRTTGQPSMRRNRETTSPLSSVPSSASYAGSISPRPSRQRARDPSHRDQRTSQTSHHPRTPSPRAQPLECVVYEIPDDPPEIPDDELEKLVEFKFVGPEPRERLFRDCKPLHKLFGQAVAAGIVDSSPDDNVISASVNGGRAIKIVKGDETDWMRLIEAIRDSAAVKKEGGVGSCVVEIRGG